MVTREGKYTIEKVRGLVCINFDSSNQSSDRPMCASCTYEQLEGTAKLVVSFWRIFVPGYEVIANAVAVFKTPISENPV